MNIKEISKLSGVSRSTVSRVINDEEHVRPEVKERVLRVIQETCYIPSSRAKNLRRMKSDIIGVIVPGFERQFVTQLITTIENRLESAGFQMMISSTKYDYRNVIGALKNMIGRADGIILMEPSLNEEMNNMVRDFPIPVVHVGLTESAAISLIHRDWDAYYKMTEYLLGKGYRNLAVCYSMPINIEEKNRAIESVLNKNGLSLHPDLIFKGTIKKNESENRNEIISRIFSLETLPSAFIVDYDPLAVDIIREIKMRCLRVPSDVAVISFGDTIFAKMSEPALTSCNVNHDKIGELASDIVIKLVNNETVNEKSIIIEPIIIERGSA